MDKVMKIHYVKLECQAVLPFPCNNLKHAAEQRRSTQNKVLINPCIRDEESGRVIALEREFQNGRMLEYY